MHRYQTFERAALMAVVAFVAAIAVLVVAPHAQGTADATAGSRTRDVPAAAAVRALQQAPADAALRQGVPDAADSSGARTAIEMFRDRAVSCLAGAADGTDCVCGAVDDLLLRLDTVLPEDFGEYAPFHEWWGDGFDPFEGFGDDLDGFGGDGFDPFDGFGDDLDGFGGGGFDPFDGFGDDLDSFGGIDDIGSVIATYPVVDGALAASDVPPEHQAIWERFTQLIPSAYRGMVAELEIFTDGWDGVLAAVAPLDSDPTQWTLSIDPADAADPDELTASLIHEFGHLLTLNHEQVPALPGGLGPFAYEPTAITCSTYLTFEGCSLQESYINVFVARFWDDILAEFNELSGAGEFSDGFWADLDAFERKYGDRFVTEYAMTDPAEDLAESFMVFVLNDRPGGSGIAEQKVLFFYEYAELVSLRAAIRAAL